MTDEQNTTISQPETTETNYIEVISEMKKNTVSKQEYNKVLEENKQLLNAMVSGQQLNVPTPEPEVDINEIRNDLFTKDMTNLDYATKALALRNELLKRGERDPFVPYGHNYLPTDFDIAEADKAADALQHCIDVADGDPAIFQNELQRILVDTIPVIKKNNINRRY